MDYLKTPLYFIGGIIYTWLSVLNVWKTLNTFNPYWCHSLIVFVEKKNQAMIENKNSKGKMH